MIFLYPFDPYSPVHNNVGLIGSPAAQCCPWSQTHPWADKWCRPGPYTGRNWQAGTWSSYCTLSRQKGESWLLGWIISHLYSAERMKAGFEMAARTHVQTIEMHTVSQVQICHSNDALLFPIVPSLALFLKSLTSSVPPWTPSATGSDWGSSSSLLKCYTIH